MQSHYRINVSVDGRHLFATADHSFTDMTERGYQHVIATAKALLEGLGDQFAGKRVQVDVTMWEGKGTTLWSMPS
jgi:hypothetical protein